MPTQRQIAAAKEIAENGRNKGKALVKVGYSANTAVAPSKVLESKGFKEAMKPILERMEEERDRAIKAMKGKISKAKYRDLVDSADKLTKNIQLLSGRATENHLILPLNEEQAQRILDRANRRRSKE